MKRKGIIAWICGLCVDLRLSQRKTLAEIVLGCMRCRRVSIGEIGRAVETDALTKHRIKQVDRFLANNRVDIINGARGLIGFVAKRAKQLIIAIDWVDVRNYKVLRAAVPFQGRSIPIMCAVYEKWRLHKSQNSFEETFMAVLKACLPQGTEAIIIADRGFHRAEFARKLQELGLHYVIRINPGVWFESEALEGRLTEFPVKPGKSYDLGFGQYRKTKPVNQRIVVHWRENEKDPWFLSTDLEFPVARLVKIFRRRMMIEEMFRDEKNLRYGWGLRHVQIGQEGRMERLLLALMYAYVTLILLGLFRRSKLPPSHWCSTSKAGMCSLFFIARAKLDHPPPAVSTLLRLLVRELREIADENWG